MKGWNIYPVWPKIQHYCEPLGNITATNITRVYAANTATSANDLTHHYTPTASCTETAQISPIFQTAVNESPRVLIQCTVVNIKFLFYLQVLEELVSFGSQKRFIFNALLNARRKSTSDTANTTFWEPSFFLRLRTTITGVTINITKVPNERQCSQVTRSDPLENSWSNADLRSAKKSHKEETTFPSSRRFPVRMRVDHGAEEYSLNSSRTTRRRKSCTVGCLPYIIMAVAPAAHGCEDGLHETENGRQGVLRLGSHNFATGRAGFPTKAFKSIFRTAFKTA